MKSLAKFMMIFLYIFLFSSSAYAAFVEETKARVIAVNWILKDSNMMKAGMGHIISDTLTCRGGIHGEPGYYVIFFNPKLV